MRDFTQNAKRCVLVYFFGDLKMGLKSNEERWKIGDIVIHIADEPLHRNQYKNKMLMVIIGVNEYGITKSRYIYPDEVKEKRNEHDIRRHIQEELPILLEKQTFSEFQNKCRYKHEADMRKVYVNHYSRLYPSWCRDIVVTADDYFEARKYIK